MSAMFEGMPLGTLTFSQGAAGPRYAIEWIAYDLNSQSDVSGSWAIMSMITVE
jgi:hypothetical protein